MELSINTGCINNDIRICGLTYRKTVRRAAYLRTTPIKLNGYNQTSQTRFEIDSRE